MNNGTDSASATDLQAVVTNIFRAHTLYAAEQLELHSQLEGELGIDSVLLDSIFADLRSTLGLPRDTLVRRGLLTLGDVVAAVSAAMHGGRGDHKPAAGIEAAPATPAGGNGALAPQPRPRPPASDARAVVLAAIQERTRRPATELELESELAADLGLDAAALESLLSEIADDLRIAREVLASRHYATIHDLVEAALAAMSTGPSSAATEPSAPPEERDPRVERIRALVARSTGGAPAPRSDDQSFAAGLSPAARERLLGELAAELDLPPVLRLDECDTIDKLVQYTSAAARHATVPLARSGAAAPPSAGADLGDDGDGRTMKDFVELRDPDLFAKVRSFNTFFREKQRQNLYWYGMPLESPCRNRVVVYDEVAGRRRELLMFASNNYLGLANHPRVIEAITEATARFGSTNTGCRLIGGTNALHKELERRLAAFKGTESCIIYPSGYSANLGAISALVKRHDAVIVDKYNHMSIVDGCKLSGGQRKIFAHNDMRDLERVLAGCGDAVDGKLIAVDGVFSMHGDICDLPEIVRLARSYGARVLVDDAHATGVLGPRGTGTAEHFGLRGGADVDLELGTMSKTLAGLGGFVCGDAEVIEYLRFYSNSYVFAANIPAGVAAGLIASIDVMEQEPERLTRLWDNIRHLRAQLEAAGLDTGGANSAIVPVVVGDDRTTLRLGRAVRARGLFCQTVVFPGVSVGDARLRISVTSEHTREDLDLAADIVITSARDAGVIPARAS